MMSIKKFVEESFLNEDFVNREDVEEKVNACPAVCPQFERLFLIMAEKAEKLGESNNNSEFVASKGKFVGMGMKKRPAGGAGLEPSILCRT